MRIRFVSTILRSFALAALIVLVSCGESSTSTPPLPPKSPVPTPTVMRTLYRFIANGTDRVTKFGPNERATYPLEAQVYYVPDQPDNSRVNIESGSERQR